MKMQWSGILVVLCVVFSVCIAEEKEQVATLDHTNFTDIVTKHNFVVVEFYAPW